MVFRTVYGNGVGEFDDEDKLTRIIAICNEASDADDIVTMLSTADVENEDSQELSKFRDKYDALELEIEQSTKQTDRLLSESIAKYRREGLSRLDVTLRLINVLRIVVAQYGQS